MRSFSALSKCLHPHMCHPKLSWPDSIRSNTFPPFVKHLATGQFSFLGNCQTTFEERGKYSLFVNDDRSPPLCKAFCNSMPITNFPYDGFSRSPYCTQEQKKQEMSRIRQRNTPKLSHFQKFKLLYRRYWYVLIPVHVITSIGWFSCFYYLAKSGVDVVATLECLGASEILVNPLRDSSAGHIAVAYGLFKIATPLRYAATLGGTTLSMRTLVKCGLVKPGMTKEEGIQEKYLKSLMRGAKKKHKV